jgi:hypothetical protein
MKNNNFNLFLLLYSFVGVVSFESVAQNCSHYNSAVNPNFCCGHDPEFTSQSNSHRLYDNQYGSKNFCDDSNFQLVKISSVSSMPDGWILIWSDDFSYTTFDDGFYNNTDLTGTNNYGLSTPHTSGEPPQVITPDNVSLTNGKMIITAKYHPNPNLVFSYFPPYTNPLNQSHVDYSVGSVSTRMKWPINSRYQASIKISPNTPATFPAWWLYGRNAQEIDIFEFREEGANRLIMTYHNPMDGTWGIPKQEEGTNHRLTIGNSDLFADQGFHQYDLIWDQFKTHWYFDGQVVHNVSRLYWKNNWNNNNIQKYYRETPMKSYNDIASHIGTNFMSNRHYPFQHPMELIWDIHLLQPTTPNDVGPTKGLETDYVKIWLRGCYGANSVFQNNYVETPDVYHGSIIEKGYTVITQIGSVINIPQYHHAIYAALEEVGLNDGFSVEDGGNFFSFITTCDGSWDSRTSSNNSYTEETNENIVDIRNESTFNSDSRKDIVISYEDTKIKIKSTVGSIYSISIYDMNGQLVYVSSEKADEMVLDKINFPPAIYTVVINTETASDIRKLWIIR